MGKAGVCSCPKEKTSTECWYGVRAVEPTSLQDVCGVRVTAHVSACSAAACKWRMAPLTGAAKTAVEDFFRSRRGGRSLRPTPVAARALKLAVGLRTGFVLVWGVGCVSFCRRRFSVRRGGRGALYMKCVMYVRVCRCPALALPLRVLGTRTAIPSQAGWRWRG